MHFIEQLPGVVHAAQITERGDQNIKSERVGSDSGGGQVFVQKRKQVGPLLFEGALEESVVEADGGREGRKTAANGMKLGNGGVEEARFGRRQGQRRQMKSNGVGRRKRNEEVVEMAKLGEQAGPCENASNDGDGGGGYARGGRGEQVLEIMPAKCRVLGVLVKDSGQVVGDNHLNEPGRGACPPQFRPRIAVG